MFHGMTLGHTEMTHRCQNSCLGSVRTLHSALIHLLQAEMTTTLSLDVRKSKRAANAHNTTKTIRRDDAVRFSFTSAMVRTGY